MYFCYMDYYDYLDGLIPIALGIYLLLTAYKIIPRKDQYAKKWKIWDEKLGIWIKILAPLSIVYGIANLFGYF